MPISIEIDNSAVQPLIEFLISRQKLIRDNMAREERELKDLAHTILKLRSSMKDPTTMRVSSIHGDTAYSEKWPWVKKISFILEQADRPLTTKEIVEMLGELEPEFILDRKRAVASVSSTLSVKTGEVFEKSESESGENAYALKKQEWRTVDARSYVEEEDLPF